MPFERNFDHLDAYPSTFYIDVGSNSFATLAEEVFVVEAFKRGAFLLTFEPLLDKYAALISRHSSNDYFQGLGLQHERHLVLPLAVGCNGTSRFHVTSQDGCSSLLQPRGQEDFRQDPKSEAWPGYVGGQCLQQVEERRVPCVSLEHVIGRWLKGGEVEHIKIDAQGFDLHVILSAGRYLDRVRSVTMEVVCNSVAGLYVGASNCSAVYWKMKRAGFVTAFQPRYCSQCMEADIHFARRGATLPPHLHNLVWNLGWRLNP